MMTEKPTIDVSIIMVTCRRPTLLFNSVRCLQDQTLQPQEILIIDNGSTDQQLAEIEQFTAPFSHIKVLAPGLKNTSAARNFGLALATSTYLLVLDDDDLLHRDALRLMATAMQDRKLDVCFTNYLFFYSNSNQVDIGVLDHRYITKRKIIAIAAAMAQALPRLRVNRNSFAFICYSSPLIHSVMFRRDCVQTIRFDPAMVYCEDLHFWHNLTSSVSKIGFCNHTLSYYRRHEGNLTHEYSVSHSYNFYDSILRRNSLSRPLDLFFLHLKLWKYGRQLPGQEKETERSRKFVLRSWRQWIVLPFVWPSLLLLRYNRTVGK